MAVDVGTMSATWTDPTGQVWQLTDISPELGWFTTPAVAGWGAAPYEIVTDPQPRGGETVRNIRQQPARLQWPLHIYGETHGEFLLRWRNIKRAFMSTVHLSAPGVLRVSRPDGTAREISAFYEDGLRGEAGGGWLREDPVVTLYCPEGAWRAVQPTIVTRSAGASVGFLSPFGTISSSQVLGTTQIDNPGELIAWPTWTITGPATAVTATNTTTGQSFTLTYTLSAGQSATITTNRPTVRGPAGENISGSLNWPGAYLWPLMPGTNDITFAVAGAGTGTQITLAFYARYDGA